MKTTNCSSLKQWLSVLTLISSLTLTYAGPQIASIDVTPTPVRTGASFSVAVATSTDVTGGYVIADLRPTTPQMYRLPLQNTGTRVNGNLVWRADGAIPAGLNPASTAYVTFRAFAQDQKGVTARAVKSVRWITPIVCDSFGSYGPADWPLALERCRSDLVLEACGSLDNVQRIDVLRMNVFDGPGGTFVVADCPPEYSYCVENRNDGTGNSVKLGVVERDSPCDRYGSYGPADWPYALERCRSDHVLQVGRSLDKILRIDVLRLNVFDGPGGTFVVADCPSEYSYCLENRNDGTGNSVKLGVVESAGPCDRFGSYGPANWPYALERCRSDHVLEVGRSLDSVIRIDVLRLNVFDGPGGTFVVADCPSEYSYCLENLNDGTGNSVKLGVVESPCHPSTPPAPSP